jgi:hypothetical protein
MGLPIASDELAFELEESVWSEIGTVMLYFPLNGPTIEGCGLTAAQEPNGAAILVERHEEDKRSKFLRSVHFRRGYEL